MCWFHSTEPHFRMTQITPDPHFILWRLPSALFCRICLRGPPDIDFQIITFLLRAQTCFLNTPGATVLNLAKFRMKAHKHKNMLQTLTRSTFGICTCHSGLQNGHVVRHFLKNSHCHSMNLLRTAWKTQATLTQIHIIFSYFTMLYDYTEIVVTSFLIHR